MRKLFNALKYETILGVKSHLRYKVGFVSDFIVFFAIYLSVLFFGTGASMGESYGITDISGRVFALIGVIFWQFSIITLGFSTSMIENAFSRGTLELRLQSIISPISLIFVRGIIPVFSGVVTLVPVLLISYVHFDLLSQDLIKLFLSVVVVIPSIIGMFGMGLIISGLTLKEKNIGQFLMIFQGILLFISNSIIPSSSKLVNILPFPTGTEIMRLIYLGRSVPVGHVSWYIIINAAWFIVGILIFNIMLKEQKRRGSFDTY